MSLFADTELNTLNAEQLAEFFQPIQVVRSESEGSTNEQLVSLYEGTELEGSSEQQIADFLKIPEQRKDKIHETISLEDAIAFFYRDLHEQGDMSGLNKRCDLLAHIYKYLVPSETYTLRDSETYTLRDSETYTLRDSETYTLCDIMMTNVAGDGFCPIYSFVAHLKIIGTFSLSYEDIGLTPNDPNYLSIVNQYIEHECANIRNKTIEYYNLCVRQNYKYLPLIDETTCVCSPHILLYLSLVYSTVIIIIHYEDGVENPTIVNGMIEGFPIEDYTFMLCKGAHMYHLHVPNKDRRKNIHEFIVNNNRCQTIDMRDI
jgi:hypothetical protein